MRVNGAWLPSDDGVIRPIVPGLLRLPDGHWLEVSFLLDAGADRTVFSADFFSLLEPLETASQRVLLCPESAAPRIQSQSRRRLLLPETTAN